jgi:hypothetical protein
MTSLLQTGSGLCSERVRNLTFWAPFLSLGLLVLTGLTAFFVYQQGWPEIAFHARHYASFGVVVAGIVLYGLWCSGQGADGHRKRVLGLGLMACLWILISGKIGAGIAVVLFLAGSYALGVPCRDDSKRGRGRRRPRSSRRAWACSWAWESMDMPSGWRCISGSTSRLCIMYFFWGKYFFLSGKSVICRNRCGV